MSYHIYLSCMSPPLHCRGVWLQLRHQGSRQLCDGGGGGRRLPCCSSDTTLKGHDRMRCDAEAADSATRPGTSVSTRRVSRGSSEWREMPRVGPSSTQWTCRLHNTCVL